MAKGNTRRTHAQLFIDTLQEMSGNEQKLISNKALMTRLGWDQDRYDRIKDQLIGQDKIIRSKGRGGTVGLASAPGTMPLKVFISYSHIDEKLKEEFLKHLRPLMRQNLISEWHDRKLKAGDEWDKAISHNLEHAQIIILLISIDFINSNYCYDIELEKALELHDKKEAIVIPVILRSCMWQHTPFGKIQALPKDGKAATTWADIDEAFVNVAEGIRIAAKALLDSL